MLDNATSTKISCAGSYISKYFSQFIIKIQVRPDISCDSSARKKKTVTKFVVCCSFDMCSKG